MHKPSLLLLAALLSLASCREQQVTSDSEEQIHVVREGQRPPEGITSPLVRRKTEESDKETIRVRANIVRERLDRVILPTLAFENAPLDEVFAYLLQKSIELDPERDITKKGIGLIIHKEEVEKWSSESSLKNEDSGSDLLLGDHSEQMRITLRCENISVGQAIFEICQQVGMDAYLGGKVVLLPAGVQPDEEDYLVPYRP